MGSYGEAYGGVLGRFWQEVFAGLPATARVLDVATGNGVLPRMLLAQCRSPGVTCDAVDIATVRFPWLRSLPPAAQRRVRVHGGIDAAALPFDDGAFDLVTSHYGIEYSDLGRSVGELLRVRAPGGRVALVVHHAAGRPAMLARLEVGHLEWLLRKDGLLDAAGALAAPMARASTPEGRAALERDAQAHRARERLNALLQELATRAEAADGADVLHEVREHALAALARAGREGAGMTHMQLLALREELAAGATRLRDLCAHALPPDDAARLRERIARGTGAPLSLEALHEEGGYLMGWGMR